ncbi:MAG TPA: hypothetical protein VK788_28855 [Terriglobales bacterium]|jgi:hypothetical protein|nr:hypothetical protein [Terriglobales bacterium]
MGKLPAFMFYPGDWQKDPCLRRCSKAAKGVWMDMLCLLFECPVRGVFVDSSGKPWSDEEIAEAIGGDIGTNLGHIAELVSKGVAQRDTRGAIFSRRMVRDEQTRRSATERKRKERSSHTRVTPLSVSEDESGRQSKLFVEVKEFEEEKKLIDNLSSAVDQIGHLFPANSHLKGRPLPQLQQDAIAEAIAKDGVDQVLCGTRSFADKVLNWPPTDLRFIPNPVKFYTEGQYLKKPEFWERRKENGREECTQHPDSRRTQSGACWECYSTKYASGCQPA